MQEASFEYLEKESEIQCLETMDQLEIAFDQSVSCLLFLLSLFTGTCYFRYFLLFVKPGCLYFHLAKTYRLQSSLSKFCPLYSN